MDYLIFKPLIKSSDFFFNKNIEKHLSNIISICKKSEKLTEIPNILFYGSKGCGKHSIIEYFIFNLLDCPKINEDFSLFKYDNFEVVIKSEIYNFKITPYFLLLDNLNYLNDKTIIQTVIKKYVSNKTLDNQIKFIIIDNVENLSYYSQMSLRRTMEIYNRECKFILISENKENILKPLISRCITFRISKPTNEELGNLLDHLISEYSLTLSIEQRKRIIESSENVISNFYVQLNKEIFNIEMEDITKQYYEKIFDVLFDNDVTNFEFIRNNILEIIKYGDSIPIIIEKINCYIYSHLNNKSEIDQSEIDQSEIDQLKI